MYGRNISSRFSRNSEANASEFLVNLEVVVKSAWTLKHSFAAEFHEKCLRFWLTSHERILSEQSPNFQRVYFLYWGNLFYPYWYLFRYPLSILNTIFYNLWSILFIDEAYFHDNMYIIIYVRGSRIQHHYNTHKNRFSNI